jgi:hypothetical protein
MKKEYLYYIAVLFIFTLTSVFGHPQTGSIKGQIYIEGLGMLLSNTEATFRLDGSECQKITTDEKGFYKIERLPINCNKLSVTVQGVKQL